MTDLGGAVEHPNPPDLHSLATRQSLLPLGCRLATAVSAASGFSALRVYHGALDPRKRVVGLLLLSGSIIDQPPVDTGASTPGSRSGLLARRAHDGRVRAEL
jgi:hypothetical protein